MFGLNGDDMIDGGPNSDIILGGPDGCAAPGGPPNSDLMFGGPGNDVSLWAPGDGSEAFIGGPGLDAIIFGGTDRNAAADPKTGVRLPTLTSGVARVSAGHPHCGREWSDTALHRGARRPTRFDYLVRFRGAAGNIIVTVRVSGVEQVFCPSEGGAGIAFADLTLASPVFLDVSQGEVEILNALVGAMIR